MIAPVAEASRSLQELNLPQTECDGRLSVLREAVKWLGTPYHHGAGVQGAGVDCAHLLIEVFHRSGLAPRIDPGFYRSGMALLRRGETMYLDLIRRFADRVDRAPLPGDIAVFRFVHLTHGGIVLRWPLVIHAYLPAGKVIVSDCTADHYLGKRFESVFSLRSW